MGFTTRLGSWLYGPGWFLVMSSVLIFGMYILWKGLHLDYFTSSKIGFTVITKERDPGKYWGIAGMISAFNLFISLLLFFRIFSLLFSKGRNPTNRTLEKYSSEIQVLLAYGLFTEALDLISEANELYPDAPELKELSKLAADKRM